MVVIVILIQSSQATTVFTDHSLPTVPSLRPATVQQAYQLLHRGFFRGVVQRKDSEPGEAHEQRVAAKETHENVRQALCELELEDQWDDRTKENHEEYREAEHGWQVAVNGHQHIPASDPHVRQTTPRPKQQLHTFTQIPCHPTLSINTLLCC